MKTYLKYGALFCVCILLVGCDLVQHAREERREQDKQELAEFIDSPAAKKLIEDELLQRDRRAFTPEGKIQSYTVEYDSLSYISVGGMTVTIHINHNPELFMIFIITQDEYTNELNIESRVESLEVGYFLEGQSY